MKRIMCRNWSDLATISWRAEIVRIFTDSVTWPVCVWLVHACFPRLPSMTSLSIFPEFCPLWFGCCCCGPPLCRSSLRITLVLYGYGVYSRLTRLARSSGSSKGWPSHVPRPVTFDDEAWGQTPRAGRPPKKIGEKKKRQGSVQTGQDRQDSQSVSQSVKSAAPSSPWPFPRPWPGTAGSSSVDLAVPCW